MEPSVIFFILFTTGLYGSIAIFSVNEVLKNKKRKISQNNNKVTSKLKDII
jgi:hypothetical protein